MTITKSELKLRSDRLLELGFSEAGIERIVRTWPTLFEPEVVYRRMQDLRRLGFKDPVKMITSLPNIVGFRLKENILPKIAGLKVLGFKDPVKMITTLPAIFALALEDNIKPKVDGLRVLGFTDPIKLIQRLPAILSYDLDRNIVGKIDNLRALGFTDPIKMITTLPAILALDLECNIKPKIAGLKTLGFTDPIKLISRLPAILSYDINRNIGGKIDGLKTLGFTNPVGLITTLPAILALDLEGNIKPKLEMIGRVSGSRSSACRLVEEFATVLGYRAGRISFVLALAGADGLVALITINPEKLALGYLKCRSVDPARLVEASKSIGPVKDGDLDKFFESKEIDENLKVLLREASGSNI